MSNPFKLEQSFLCIEIPFANVIYPIISSPGIGEQHLANFTKQLSIPSTSTSSLLLFFLFLVTTFNLVSSAGAKLSSYSSTILFTTFTGDILPNPIFS